MLGPLGKDIQAIAMVALILAVPVLAQEMATDAVIEAQRQAEADFDRTMWLGVGCLLGPTGVLIAYGTDREIPGICGCLHRDIQMEGQEPADKVRLVRMLGERGAIDGASGVAVNRGCI